MQSSADSYTVVMASGKHDTQGDEAMATATAISEARQAKTDIEAMDDIGVHLGRFGYYAPSAVYHDKYSVRYFSDSSILIWADGEDMIVLDGECTYYRDTVEHLAMCLGEFSREKRAEIVGDDSRWIDGIHWAANGSFIEM